MADRSFADFAVLYRLGAQSQPLSEALQRSGIPYQMVGQTPLAAYLEVEEVLAYLWLIYNPDSVFHLEQILRFKKREAFVQLLSLTEEQQRSLGELLQDFELLDIFNATQKKSLKKLIYGMIVNHLNI